MLIIHHLNRSRSERIVWLAEELGLPYRIVRHQRDTTTLRAPASLKAVSPLGKSPAIEDGAVTLAESGAIVDYLLEKYGQGRLRPAVHEPAWPQYLHWMHAAEATLMLPLMTDLLTRGIKPRDSVEGFVRKEYATVLGHLNTLLEQQDYVAGNDFTAADIMVAFPLSMINTELFPGRGLPLMATLDDYPAIRAYLQGLQARPGWQRAVAEFVE